MNKDRVKGKIKDVAGRVERQAGEWTDDPTKQAKGASKQVEDKVQNAWGKAEDAAKRAADEDKNAKPPQRVSEERDYDESAGGVRRSQG